MAVDGPWNTPGSKTQPEAPSSKVVAALREAREYILDNGSERTMAPVIQRIDDALQGETSARRYHANGTYWSGTPTVDMPCDFCTRPIVDHDPRTHACPSETTCSRCRGTEIVLDPETNCGGPCPDCSPLWRVDPARPGVRWCAHPKYNHLPHNDGRVGCGRCGAMSLKPEKAGG